ncbi:DUF6221 family protein [Streptomyces sp. NPDC102394]|uniref:DUF6221 family protein n=1 Tax=Streptomyces sp. NPDC102394 TaxID=3366167 RepID=UPI00382A80F3
MDDFVPWYGQQLDDDERIAREASGSTVVGEPGNWQPSPAGDEWEACAGEIEEELLVALRPGLPRPPDVMSGYWGAWVSQEPDTCDPDAGSAMPALTHAARHDPARVLRDVAAKRQNLAELKATEDAMSEASRDRDATRYNQARAAWTVLRRVVRRDAAVYADRPGYREEWRP